MYTFHESLKKFGICKEIFLHNAIVMTIAKKLPFSARVFPFRINLIFSCRKPSSFLYLLHN